MTRQRAGCKPHAWEEADDGLVCKCCGRALSFVQLAREPWRRRAIEKRLGRELPIRNAKNLTPPPKAPAGLAYTREEVSSFGGTRSGEVRREKNLERDATIRRRVTAGESQANVARSLGISRKSVWRVMQRV